MTFVAESPDTVFYQLTVLELFDRKERMNLGASAQNNNNSRSIHWLVSMSNQQVDKLPLLLWFIDQHVI